MIPDSAYDAIADVLLREVERLIEEEPEAVAADG